MENRKGGPIYYYESLHSCDDGKDIYLHILYERKYPDGSIEMVYEESMTWNYTMPRDRMISFRNSGREKELKAFIYNKGRNIIKNNI